ncbi:MAG: hypothetical protein P4L61_00530 [Candidatus Pacebacteria bacterium]|nr:hypothetical protein [Candidatus Paceibacterota bacterium]
MSITTLLHTKRSRKPAYSSEQVTWRERIGEDAYVGWAIIVSISFVIMLILVGYAGWLFFLVDTGAITAAQTANTPADHPIFSQKSLDDLIVSFETKAETTSSLEHGFTGPADPSQ